MRISLNKGEAVTIEIDGGVCFEVWVEEVNGKPCAFITGDSQYSDYELCKPPFSNADIVIVPESASEGLEKIGTD